MPLTKYKNLYIISIRSICTTIIGGIMEHAKRQEKLYTQTFRQIRPYIIENNVQPGDLLPPEQKLSAELGVSRNVLREAIKSMELMGMVSASPGRGTVVMPFNLDFVMQNVLFFRVGDNDQQVREMFGIRRMLERDPPSRQSRFYAFGIDERGMAMEYLV